MDRVKAEAGRAPLPTRILLICAALAVIQLSTYVLLTPVTTALAAAAPPAYALIAGAHTVLPLTARLVTHRAGTATLTAAFTGIIAAALTPVGWLILVPALAAGAAFDLVMPWRARRGSGWRVATAAIAAGVLLFLVSLPVFSSEHLTGGVLTATLVGRVVGELIAVAIASRLAWLLARAGVAPAG